MSNHPEYWTGNWCPPKRDQGKKKMDADLYVTRVDRLGVAISDSGIVWTPAMRKAFDESVQSAKAAVRQYEELQECKRRLEEAERREKNLAKAIGFTSNDRR